VTAPIFRFPIRTADIWGLNDADSRKQEDIAADLDYQDNSIEQFLSDQASDTVTQVEAVAVPSGCVFYTGSSTIPDGYLTCDGAAVSRTTYADLFTAIGTTFGVGNGSTTFNVPDIKGRVVAGKETSETRLTTAVSGINGGTLGASGGSQLLHLHAHAPGSHTHTMAHTHSTPAHVHSLYVSGGFDINGDGATAEAVFPDSSGDTSGTHPSSGSGTSGAASTATTSTPSASNTGDAGTGTTQNVQPTIVLNAIIKT
jgi:microcystin-dependent protein